MTELVRPAAIDESSVMSDIRPSQVDESNARESIAESRQKIIINETVNSMRANNSTRQPMLAKVPSQTIKFPKSFEEEKEVGGSDNLSCPAAVSVTPSSSKATLGEGQHEDQNEEEAQAPKRANKQQQPPQLRARVHLDAEDQLAKEELEQALPRAQKDEGGAQAERAAGAPGAQLE